MLDKPWMHHVADVNFPDIAHSVQVMAVYHTIQTVTRKGLLISFMLSSQRPWDMMSSLLVGNGITVSSITRTIQVPILENHEGTSYTCLVVMLMVLFIAKENWFISYHVYVSSQPFSSGLVQHKEFSLIMHVDVVVSLTTMEFLILLNPLEKIATKKKQHAHATVSSGSRFNGSGSVKLETEKT